MGFVERSEFEILVFFVEREKKPLFSDRLDAFNLGLLVLNDENHILYLIAGLDLDEYKVSRMDEGFHGIPLRLGDKVVRDIMDVDVLGRNGNLLARVFILENCLTSMTALGKSEEWNRELIPFFIVLENPVYPRRSSREIPGILELIDLVLHLLRMVDADTVPYIHKRIRFILSEFKKSKNLFLLGIETFHREKVRNKKYTILLQYMENISLCKRFFIVLRKYVFFGKIETTGI